MLKLRNTKNEMTLDCFILRSSSFFTNSDHPQSRVISLLSWYLTSFFIPLFLRTRLGFSKLLPSILIFHRPHRFLVTLRSVSGIRLPRSPHLIFLSGIWVTSSLVGTAFLVCDYIIHPASLFFNPAFSTNLSFLFYTYWRKQRHSIDVFFLFW